MDPRDPAPDDDAPDDAESGRLGDALARLVPALEVFQRFEGDDPSARAMPAWRAALDGPLPVRGAGLDAVLDDLSRVIIPHGERAGAPGFSGWVVNAPTTASTVARLAATIAGTERWCVHPFNFLETLALQWLAQLASLPASWQGVFVSGGATANLLGLGAARQHAFERHGIDPARDGLPASPRGRIYASAHTHHVVLRAAAVLGLGRAALVSLPVDETGCLDPDALADVMAADIDRGLLPVAVVANAGTTDTGAVDPIGRIADVTDRFGCWLHVDGSYGLFGRLDPRVAARFDGIERAGSVAVDPHKWLAVPIGCGAAFVRDAALFRRAFTLEPTAYLEGAWPATPPVSGFDGMGDEFHDFTIEVSAPSRGVMVWAALRELGLEGVRARIVRHNGYARRLAEHVARIPHLELVAAPTLSVCCFRYRAPGLDAVALDALNAAIAAQLRAEGAYVPSTTTVFGVYAIRPCFINPRTRARDVDGLAEAVTRIGDALLAAR